MSVNDNGVGLNTTVSPAVTDKRLRSTAYTWLLLLLVSSFQAESRRLMS